MLLERIARMAERSMTGDVYPPINPVEYDPEDMFLPQPRMDAKRLREYMAGQTVQLREDQKLVGFLRFDESVTSELFQRRGHGHFKELAASFYCVPFENLCTMEWQHSCGDFSYVLNHGLRGYLERIAAALETYEDQPDRRDFLLALEEVCHGLIDWARRCGDACAAAAETAAPERAAELLRMRENCYRVPEHPARDFYEAVQSFFFVFQCLPDGLGTLDRTFAPFFGPETDREEATALLQELFIMVSGYTRYNSAHAHKSAESHFSLGGWTEEKTDGFTALSRLILEAMLALPLYRPQVSLRWTPEMPRETFAYLLDKERTDANKRIALVADPPRVKALMEIAGMPFEEAIRYTAVGCNEPSLQGGLWQGGNTCNLVRPLTDVLYGRREEVLACRDFDGFYDLFEDSLFSSLQRMMYYSNGFNYKRSRDINILSTLFMEGCIESGKSCTQGGAKRAITGFELMGVTTVIDSLTIIAQFVFEEERVTMAELTAALDADWKGHEALRRQILRQGRFFGNNDPLSDGIARRLTGSLAAGGPQMEDIFGNKVLFGSQAGYNPHFAWFGKNTAATPNGRDAGDPFEIGVGQSGGKDRQGLTALLQSVAQMDPHCILTGPVVFNLSLEPSAVTDPEKFDKVAALLETYFRLGGLQVQLNAVSAETLRDAREHPEKYGSLRVRVSGFSAFFTELSEEFQEDLIARTVQNA